MNKILSIRVVKAVGLTLSFLILCSSCPHATMAKGQSHAAAPANSPFENFNGEEEIERLNVTISKLFDAGQYEEAIPLAKQTLSLVSAEFGQKHNKYAKALNNL